MIDYETFLKIRQYCDRDGLSIAQTAALLDLDERTVAKWSAIRQFKRRQTTRRSSKLDPYRAEITRLLHQHPYSAQQVLQRLRESGYKGGYTIVKDLIRLLRPPATTAHLTLKFSPGQCAQVDWGSAGWIQVGSVRRRLSFFVMVMAFSRRIYVEFTLGQAMEHFLSCHQKAFAYFGGVPAELWVDNCKTAVLAHPAGGPATLHPRYLELANHYGCSIRPCAPRQPQQKGRVESAVGYVKKNFLAGLELSSVDALNHAVLRWMAEVANVRCHGETGQRPEELFAQESRHLRTLNLAPYCDCVLRPSYATNRCRVPFDGNRYSVPPRYASRPVTIKIYAERVVLLHQDLVIAEHRRCYDRRQEIENPDHLEELLALRRGGRRQALMAQFMALTPHAEVYHQSLAEKRANPHHHVQKIVALAEHYGIEKVARALEDALEYRAFSAEYIANLLAQRERPVAAPSALHLTRRQDLLDLDLPAPDLSVYQRDSGGGL